VERPPEDWPSAPGAEDGDAGTCRRVCVSGGGPRSCRMTRDELVVPLVGVADEGEGAR